MPGCIEPWHKVIGIGVVARSSTPRDDCHPLTTCIHNHTATTTETPPSRTTIHLDVRIVRLGGQTLHIGELDGVRLTGTLRQSLELDRLALLLGLAPSLGVVLNAGDELLAGAAVVDVLETDVDALLDVSVADLLVDDDSDRGLGHVVDNARLAVVDLVGHALLLGTVVLDVYDVADLVILPLCGLVICSGGTGPSGLVEAYMKVLRRTMPFWRCLRAKA